MANEKIQLLLVEDDEIDREAVHRLLAPEYVVRNAAMGRQALEMIETVRPDGVLLDYRLPDLDGLEMIAVFAQKRIPVVVLTGEENPEVIVEAMKQGAQDYLMKGHISKASLKRAINNAIEKVSLRRELEEKQHKLAEQNRKIRALASELTLAEQRERRRTSQILHDNLQQTIYGIKVRKHLIALSLSPELNQHIADHLVEMEKLIEQAVETIRTLTVQLSPPVLKNEGLDASFKWLVNQTREMHGLTIDLDIQGECRLASEDLRVLVFQLVRELVFNVVKHAGVNQARLEMDEQDNQISIRLRDEGVGFDPAIVAKTQDHGDSFGLYSVRERLNLFGGRLEIESRLGSGTCATVIVPKDAGTA